ncbi:MAG: site-2 protease family protein [Planctomycetota bacterium]|nr:site-2 protease family protein [Planctomycetota bacterium]
MPVPPTDSDNPNTTHSQPPEVIESRRAVTEVPDDVRNAGNQSSGVPLAYRPRKRRIKLPIILFFATCLSTFWVGLTDWQPMVNALAGGNLFLDEYPLGLRQQFLMNWGQALVYMCSIMLILLLHELGHFFTTIFYRVPATAPIFLPFPFNPIGTLGAVIGMQGTMANRKQIFDIGIAGPLAGLVIAIPLAYIGVSQLDFSVPPRGGIGFRLPLLMQWMIGSIGVEGYDAREAVVWINQLNPFFAASWVGLLITGLNMMPVGQLDGGHITYTLFGKASHWIAEISIVLAIAFMVYYQHFVLIVMVGLILIMGTHHPPTADDSVRLGPVRWIIGLLSLSIPILCFPPLVFKITY